MNEKETISLVNKLTKMIKLNQINEIKNLNQIQLLDRENYSDLFIEACATDASQIVQYMYKLKRPSDFALQDGFRCCLDTGNLNTIKMLICDLKIHLKSDDINDELKEHLKKLKNWNNDFYQQVIPLFKDDSSTLKNKKTL